MFVFGYVDHGQGRVSFVKDQYALVGMKKSGSSFFAVQTKEKPDGHIKFDMLAKEYKETYRLIRDLLREDCVSE